MALRLAVYVALVFIVSASALASLSKASAQAAPPELHEAIRQYLLSKGLQYAGDCAGTRLPDDVGKWCSAVRSLMGTTAVIGLGPTFSEFAEEVTFNRVGNAWQTGPARPPASGVGDYSARNSIPSWTWLAVVCSVIALLAFGSEFAMARSRAKHNGLRPALAR
jgi:hypothetical protein